jgi:acetylornithine deacetylase
VHAGTIVGGVELSSYPERCVIGVERRTIPGEDAAAVERDLEALLDGCRAADPALVAAQRTLLVREPFAVDPDAAIVRLVLAATEAVLGAPAPVEGASFWADSAFIAEAGIPTVLFGPSGEGAHAREEWVSIPDTLACTRVLVEVARGVCGES